MDLDTTQITVINLPKFTKIIQLPSGGKLSDDAELLAFAQKTVPAGKTATVSVMISVVKLS